jgi:uncharacterized membrane-anchored protein
LALACLLLASAGVCWIAANWVHASALQKLLGMQAVLAGLVFGATALLWTGKGGRDPDWSAPGLLMALAAVTTGALLALLGQIYQTGADPWQLFMLWTALLLPWLLAYPTLFLALATTILLNVGTYLYLDDAAPAWVSSAASGAARCSMMVILNILLLAVWESRAFRLEDRRRIGPRCMASAALGWVVVAVLASLDASTGPWGPVIAGLAVSILMGLIYSRWRPDLALKAFAALAAFVLVGIGLVAQAESDIALLGAVAALLVLSGLLMRWLLAQRPLSAAAVESASEADTPQGGYGKPSLSADSADLADHTNHHAHTPEARRPEPWPFSLFRLVVLAFTAGLAILFLQGVLDLGLEDLWATGLVACAGGVVIHRARTRPGLARDTGLTLVAAGFLMVIGGFGAWNEASTGIKVAAVLGLGLMLYVLVDPPVLRFMLAALALAFATAMTWPGSGTGGMSASEHAHASAYLPAYLRLWWLSAAAVLAWAVGSRRRDAAFWLPLAWALTVLAQSLAWLAPAPTLYALDSAWVQAPELIIIWLTCAMLPVVVLLALLWRSAVSPSLRWGAPAALAVASAGWMGMPGVALALVWLLLGYALGRKSLLAAGVLAMLAYLARFYYQLDALLLDKSLLLGLTGAWLAFCGWLMRVLAARLRPDLGVEQPVADGLSVVMDAGPSSSFRSWLRPAGLLAGLVLVLATANAGMYQHQRLLASGQVVVLSLSPVDPRSLMQGDYMALRFAVAGPLQEALQAAPDQVSQAIRNKQGGYMLLQPDDAGVHQFVAMGGDRDNWWAQSGKPWHASTAHGKPTAIVAFGLRAGGARIVTDAWFFPEGQAAHYERARYGEIRVNGEGRALLARLLDVNLQPLP